MTEFFYFMVFSSSFLLTTLLLIYYKLSSSKSIYNFIILNITYFFAFIFDFFSRYETNPLSIDIFIKLGEGFRNLSFIFLMFLIYELLTAERIKKRITLQFLSFAMLTLFGYLDLFAVEGTYNFYKILSPVLLVTVLIEIILIMIFYHKKIDSKLQIKTVRILMLLLLANYLELLLDSAFNIPKDSNSFLVLNVSLIFYLFKKIFEEIKKLKEVEAEIDKFSFDSFEEKFAEHKLTEREKEITMLILKRKSNQEIADELDISVNTVKNHTYNIYRKFDVNKKIDLLKLLL